MSIRHKLNILIITMLGISCTNTGRDTNSNLQAEVKPQQDIPVMDFEEFQPWLNKNTDTTYVINFWATWCKPCIKEMPAFIKLDRTYTDKKLELILVSLDFPKNLEDQVIPFIKKNNIHSRVVLLNDPDANLWINQVDSSWSGAIPATLIYNRNSRAFYERTFTYKELDEIVKSKM